MRKLKGASLLEVIVAAVFFLTVFAAVMELLPRLTVRRDDALLVAAAEYDLGRAFGKYGTGLWPWGEYVEVHDWGTICVKISPYRDFGDMHQIGIEARIEGSSKCVGFKQIVECGQ